MRTAVRTFATTFRAMLEAVGRLYTMLLVPSHTSLKTIVVYVTVWYICSHMPFSIHFSRNFSRCLVQVLGNEPIRKKTIPYLLPLKSLGSQGAAMQNQLIAHFEKNELP